jgi:hypothetical protein
MKLVEIILLQQPKVDVICLKKLVEIILLQQPKVDIILFDETGGDHFTSATPS